MNIENHEDIVVLTLLVVFLNKKHGFELDLGFAGRSLTLRNIERNEFFSIDRFSNTWDVRYKKSKSKIKPVDVGFSHGRLLEAVCELGGFYFGDASVVIADQINAMGVEGKWETLNHTDSRSLFSEKAFDGFELALMNAGSKHVGFGLGSFDIRFGFNGRGGYTTPCFRLKSLKEINGKPIKEVDSKEQEEYFKRLFVIVASEVELLLDRMSREEAALTSWSDVEWF